MHCRILKADEEISVNTLMVSAIAKDIRAKKSAPAKTNIPITADASEPDENNFAADTKAIIMYTHPANFNKKAIKFKAGYTLSASDSSISGYKSCLKPGSRFINSVIIEFLAMGDRLYSLNRVFKSPVVTFSNTSGWRFKSSGIVLNSAIDMMLSLIVSSITLR